jgi:CHASE2 domain-containing sensor protein
MRPDLSSSGFVRLSYIRSAIMMCLVGLIVLGLMFFGLPFYEELLWIPVLPMGVGMVLYAIASLRSQAE